MKKIKPNQTRKPRNLVHKQMIERQIGQNDESDSTRERRSRRPIEEKNDWRHELDDDDGFNY